MGLIEPMVAKKVCQADLALGLDVVMSEVGLALGVKWAWSPGS